jgi:anti-anti-sigma regulatory factor
MGIPQFTVNQDSEGVFRFKGSLTIHDIGYLKKTFETSFSNTKKISICMSEVTFADTASLQLIIAFRRALGPETEWDLSGLSPELEKILEISDLKTALVD